MVKMANLMLCIYLNTKKCFKIIIDYFDFLQ